MAAAKSEEIYSAMTSVSKFPSMDSTGLRVEAIFLQLVSGMRFSAASVGVKSRNCIGSWPLQAALQNGEHSVIQIWARQSEMANVPNGKRIIWLAKSESSSHRATSMAALGPILLRHRCLWKVRGENRRNPRVAGWVPKLFELEEAFIDDPPETSCCSRHEKQIHVR